MKLNGICIMFLTCVMGMGAQTLPDNYVTVGLFYNSYATPQVSGFAAYAKKIGDSTYSYTVMDVTSSSLKVFKPETQTSTGIAQMIKQTGGINVFALAAAGVTVASSEKGAANTAGTDIGVGGTAGFLFVKPLKNGWSLDIPVRILASTVGPPQYVVGIGFGWGK